MLTDSSFLETIFSTASTLAMIGWIVLVFLPRRWPVLNAVPALIVPGLIAIAYAGIILPALGNGPDGGGFSTLDGVMALFTSPAAVLAGWLHYLAFDLLVGVMIAREEDRQGISRLVQAPILFMTFMFGPAGFLLHLVVSNGWRLFRRPATA